MSIQRIEILVLGSSQIPAYFSSVEQELSKFANLTYISPTKFKKTAEIIPFVQESNFDCALMHNPYTHEHTMWLYKNLRKIDFPVIVSDRGALPNSWFFDRGFNADSPTYHPVYWDNELTEKENAACESYISNLKRDQSALEHQTLYCTPKTLKSKLGISKKKVIFVPFQRPNDATIKYFSDNIGGFQEFCKFVQNIQIMLAKDYPDWILIGKKHPLEITSPNIDIRFVDENINSLLSISDLVIVINSGVGLIASLWEKPVLYAGSVFYAHPGLNRPVNSLLDIRYYIENTFPVDIKTRNRFIYYLKNRVYSYGDFEVEKVFDGKTIISRTKSISFSSINFPEVRKKKILFVSPVIPWPITRGSEQRTDQNIRALLELGYIIHLLILNEREHAATSKSIRDRLYARYGKNHIKIQVRRHPKFHLAKSILKSSIKSLIFSFFYLLSKKYRRLTYEFAKINSYDNFPFTLRKYIRRYVKSADYIWFNYAKCVPDKMHFNIPTIIDMHDFQSNRIKKDLERMAGINKEKYFSVFYNSERKVINKVNYCVSISDVETLEIRNACPNANVLTINATSENKYINKKSNCFDIVFLGSDSPSNADGLLWFLSCIWKDILVSCNFSLLIQGNITKNKRLLDKIDKDSQLKETITIGKYVTDLSIVYNMSKLSIAPLLYGTGMKIKVIESMSYGVPTIGTSVAYEGISSRFGLRGYDDPGEFGSMVVKLLTDAVIYNKWKQKMQETFEAYHSTTYLKNSLKHLFNKIDHP